MNSCWMALACLPAYICTRVLQMQIPPTPTPNAGNRLSGASWISLQPTVVKTGIKNSMTLINLLLLKTSSCSLTTYFQRTSNPVFLDNLQNVSHRAATTGNKFQMAFAMEFPNIKHLGRFSVFLSEPQGLTFVLLLNRIFTEFVQTSHPAWFLCICFCDLLSLTIMLAVRYCLIKCACSVKIKLNFCVGFNFNFNFQWTSGAIHKAIYHRLYSDCSFPFHSHSI